MVPMSEADPTPEDNLSEAESTARTARYLTEMMPDIIQLAQDSSDGKTVVEGQYEGQPFTIYLDMNQQTEEQ